jgi:hypothetical protein
MTITAGTGAGTSTGTSEYRTPDYRYDFGGISTIKEIIAIVLNEAGMSLNATFTSDSIIDVIKPFFSVSFSNLPSLGSMIANPNGNGLIQRTKSFLKLEGSMIMKIIYPQDADAIDKTFYSSQSPWFKEYTERLNTLTPNSVIVYWGADPISGIWDTATAQTNLETPGSAVDQDSIDNYTEIRKIVMSPETESQADANLYAAAVLSKYKSEIISGKLLLPFHACDLELMDKVSIIDVRSS